MRNDLLPDIGPLYNIKHRAQCCNIVIFQTKPSQLALRVILRLGCKIAFLVLTGTPERKVLYQCSSLRSSTQCSMGLNEFESRFAGEGGPCRLNFGDPG